MTSLLRVSLNDQPIVVRDTVDATRAAWAEHGKHYDLPEDIRDSIQKHMDDVKIGD